MKTIDNILLKEIKLRTPALLFVLLLIFLLVGFEAISPWPFKVLIDNVLGNESLDTNTFQGQILSNFSSKEALGFFIVLIYGATFIFSEITHYFVRIFRRRLGNSITYGFAVNAFGNLEQLAVGFYKQKQIGDYIYRLSYDVSAIGDLVDQGIVPLVTNFLYLASTIAILFFINVNLALVALAIMPALILALGIFNRRIGLASKSSEYYNSSLFSFIQEVLSQLKIIQAFNQETKELKSFKEREDYSVAGEFNVTGLGYMLNMAIGVLIAVGYALIFLYGIKYVGYGLITTGSLIIFIFYLDNLTNPVLSLITAAASVKEAYIKVSRMNEFFTPKFHTKDTGEIRAVENTDIVFDKVSAFAQSGTVMIKNVSIKIPMGKKTAIVGVSGSGKTTIASLILRFINPSSGKIFIGGKNITSYSIKALRNNIAYVPQEIVLFNDSIKNNIGFGYSRASAQDIQDAAELAVADKFIKRLPGGYDFVVGEEGANLSGGQRQRLMLARAFVRKHAKILILDEPLSSLDIKTRAVFMSNLNEFCEGKTTIIISNILEVIHQADHVIVVNEGTILSAGDSKSLLKESNLASLILHSS